MQVETVVVGSPATIAGLQADDGLIAVNGEPVAAPTGATPATSKTRDAANSLIARQPVDRPLLLTIQRAGQQQLITIPPSAGCRSTFEVLVTKERSLLERLLKPGLIKSSSSDDIVQVEARFFEIMPDDKISAVAAHEMSHIILDHTARKEAAGVNWGAETGRSARIIRRTEDDADRLSVHLLRNAGYDPSAAVRFWREDGRKLDWGVFRGASHGSANERAAVIAAEVATLPPAGASDDAPAVLATRDQPLR